MIYYIRNFTPHTVKLLNADNSVRGVFDSVGVARCREIVVTLSPLAYDPFEDGGMVEEAPLVSKSFGAAEGLPPADAVSGTTTGVRRMYIVSQIVADASPGRYDLIVPSNVVRDKAGVILGCREFSW
jgi:hypothetical protein